jgi:hypothetical protein
MNKVVNAPLAKPLVWACPTASFRHSALTARSGMPNINLISKLLRQI